MPAGVSITNDFGTILIDTVSPALALKQKMIVATNNQTVPDFSVTNAQTTVCAIYSPSYINMQFVSWSGTTKTHGTAIVFGASGSVSVEFYAFDKPTDSGSLYGLRLYDEAGNLTFDAVHKYARVVGELTGNGTFAGDSGRKYAGVILGSHYKDEIIDTGIPGQRRRDVRKTHIRSVNNQLIVADQLVSSITYSSNEAPYVFAEYGAPHVLVVDVSGY